MRGQPAARIVHREILLVITHHGHQHLIGQLQIFVLESAQHHARPLGKLRHRFHQRLILTPARALHGATHAIQRLADALAPHAHIGDDIRRFQLRRVIGRRRDRDWRIALQHAMAISHGTSYLAAKLHRHHCCIEQREHPPHRPHKPFRLPRTPVHILRPVDLPQLSGQLLGQDLRGAASCLRHRGGDILAFRRRLLHQCLNRHASLPGKGRGRGRRLAVLERHLPGRPGQLLGRIFLPFRYTTDQHSQPARSGVAAHIGLGRSQQLLGQ